MDPELAALQDAVQMLHHLMTLMNDPAAVAARPYATRAIEENIDAQRARTARQRRKLRHAAAGQTKTANEYLEAGRRINKSAARRKARRDEKRTR